MKKLFSLFLALKASVGIIYASNIEVDGIWYDFYFFNANNTATVTYRGSSYYEYDDEYSGSVVIPTSVTYNGTTFSVTSIGDEAFSGCNNITSVTIPNSVTSIGNYAFRGCSSLTSVTIGNSVTSIGFAAFYDCSSLTSVHITDLAAWCNIDFGDYSANPLSSAHNLYLNGELVKDLVIPNSVTSIGEDAFRGCSSLTSVTIGNSVTSIGEDAFRGCSSLTSVTIGNSVTSIGGATFHGCSSLTSVTIGNSVTSIGDYAFYYCTSLTSITCKATTPPTIGQYAFYGVSKSIPVYVPCGCVEAYKTASGWNNFTNIQVPLAEYSIEVYVNDTIMGTAKVNYNTFCEGAQISASPNIGYHFVQWSDGVTESSRALELTQDTILVAEFAQSFSGQCSDSLYWEFADSTLHITGSGTMYDYSYDRYNPMPWLTFVNSIKFVVIGNSVTSIGSWAFDGCSSLTSVTIGNSVTSIGNGAFYGCSSLTSVTIPNSVTSIGDGAFEGCSNITSVTWNAKNCNSYNFGSQVISFEFGNEVEHVPAYVCKGMEKLTSVTIPNSVKTIGTSAFEGCARLGEVSLGKSLETIGANAFAECTRLYDIYTYATYPPFAEVSSFANYNVYVYIPCEYKRDYILDVIWGKFKFIECISSDNVTTDEIVVTPSENEANVIWPSVNGAATYELVIKDKNGNIVCTLIFNANGQLTSIAFNAPSRNGAPAQTQSAGFSFTITGLDSGTGYDLTLTAKDNSGNVIEETTIPFQTNWAEGFEDIPSSSLQGGDRGRLILRDGQVLILRNGRTYTMQGQEVK